MTHDSYASHSGPEGLREATRSGERQRRRASLRRSLSLTFLSTLLPGLGLVWTRRRRLGILLAAFTLLALLTLAVVLVGGGLITGAANVLTAKGLKIALAVTIIGLPLAWANLKMIPLALFPLGKQIVPESAARPLMPQAGTPTMSRY